MPCFFNAMSTFAKFEKSNLSTYFTIRCPARGISYKSHNNLVLFSKSSINQLIPSFYVDILGITDKIDMIYEKEERVIDFELD
ncbi:hypothetical protein CVD25_07265 [Bacillus canaveralius]|uniref:Uncharacterized protein n=1 Tax=Bacillus canaveralius TaxID=1403243 RepID=A0A2N5GHC1_9BACI|nr:hypothetical protein CU635_19270 [Bacillus canaveralius]PLR83820.1 hypothetical protein CVD23_13130 [Bacillus sp. V33-4]PLR98706.1 hypothetical protein CVD25_07265 [Bacillus canaveralius]